LPLVTKERQLLLIIVALLFSCGTGSLYRYGIYHSQRGNFSENLFHFYYCPLEQIFICLLIDKYQAFLMRLQLFNLNLSLGPNILMS
jgi:hypothetical protein